jgi:ABC-2 type transport system permease protein
MAANELFQPVPERGWRQGLRPLLQKEMRDWWGTRRWLWQLLLWVGLLDGMLAVALFILPTMTTPEGEPLVPGSPVQTGQELFFGLSVLAIAIGVIILMQDVIIGEKQTGTAEWVLSRPVARPAFILAKLLVYGLGTAVFMLIIPSLIGYALFALYDPGVVTVSGFLGAMGLVALHTAFYLTLCLMLGVLVESRSALLGVAFASLIGGSMAPVEALVKISPWALGQLTLLPLQGQALPPGGMTMVVSTAVWSVLFIAVALWQFNRIEF